MTAMAGRVALFAGVYGGVMPRYITTGLTIRGPR
jgi:hypothetical protein